MRTTTLLFALLALVSTSAVAQQPPAGAYAQQPPRRPADAPRTIEGVNTVWIEQLTRPELRDRIHQHGYTTGCRAPDLPARGASRSASHPESVAAVRAAPRSDLQRWWSWSCR